MARTKVESSFADLDSMDLEMMGFEGEVVEEKREEEKAEAEKAAKKKTTARKAKAEDSEASMLDTVVPEIKIGVLRIPIVGDSSLIVHAWSEKAKKQILDKQMKKASTGREIKDPFQDYVDSAYWLDGRPENPTDEDVAKARFGFPAIAFKLCAIDAGYQQEILKKKTTARGAFHVMDEFVEIKGTPRMREDMVQVGGMTKVADIRYRMEFMDWSTELRVRYNKSAISPVQIVNLLNIGGFANGCGEWRPSRDGNHGTFHVQISGVAYES